MNDLIQTIADDIREILHANYNLNKNISTVDFFMASRSALIAVYAHLVANHCDLSKKTIDSCVNLSGEELKEILNKYKNEENKKEIK